MNTLKQDGSGLVEHLAAPDAGPWYVTDPSGKHLRQVEPIGITRAGELAELPTGAEAVLDGRQLELLRLSAASLGWTIVIDLEGSATPTIPGAGLYVAPDGEVGLHLSAHDDMGLLERISGPTRSMAVTGGPENLEGFGYAVSAEGFWGVGAGVSVLFGEDGDFQGLASKVGIGVEFGIYVGLSGTKLHVGPNEPPTQ